MVTAAAFKAVTQLVDASCVSTPEPPLGTLPPVATPGEGGRR